MTARRLDFERHQHTGASAFQQGDAASEGLGLGLWIASQTASMLGHLRMQSWPGRGTRFEREILQTVALGN